MENQWKSMKINENPHKINRKPRKNKRNTCIFANLMSFMQFCQGVLNFYWTLNVWLMKKQQKSMQNALKCKKINRKSMKINENQWKSLKINENPHKINRKPRKNNRNTYIFCKFYKFYAVLIRFIGVLLKFKCSIDEKT